MKNYILYRGVLPKGMGMSKKRHKIFTTAYDSKGVKICSTVNRHEGKHTLIAIIYDKRGRILSVGKNSYTKSIRLQRKHANLAGMPEKVMTHAEISAIAKCRSLSRAHTIKVFRYDKSGAPVNAMPCKICMSAIVEANIRNIEWTTDSES